MNDDLGITASSPMSARPSRGQVSWIQPNDKNRGTTRNVVGVLLDMNQVYDTAIAKRESMQQRHSKFTTTAPSSSEERHRNSTRRTTTSRRKLDVLLSKLTDRRSSFTPVKPEEGYLSPKKGTRARRQSRQLAISNDLDINDALQEQQREQRLKQQKQLATQQALSNVMRRNTRPINHMTVTRTQLRHDSTTAQQFKPHPPNSNQLSLQTNSNAAPTYGLRSKRYEESFSKTLVKHNLRVKRASIISHHPIIVEPESNRVLRERNLSLEVRQRHFSVFLTEADIPENRVEQEDTTKHPQQPTSKLQKQISTNKIRENTNKRNPSQQETLSSNQTDVVARPILREVQEEDSLNRCKFRRDEVVVTQTMMNLDADKMRLLKHDFISYGDSLTRHNFVRVMLQYVKTSGGNSVMVSNDNKSDMITTINDESIELVSQLLELFSQVDTDGSGTMEWEEFTEYIIGSSVDREQFRVDAIKHYHPSTAVKCSYIPPKRRDIHGMLFLDSLDQFVVLLDDSSKFLVFNSITGTIIKTVEAKGTVVHDVEYLLGNGRNTYLVTSGNDNAISFWETVGFTLCQRLPTSEAQITLRWGGHRKQFLFSGTAKGKICVWDVAKFSLVATMHGHVDSVMDLIVIPEMNSLVSASLDSQILIWDTTSLALKKKLPLVCTKGVCTMSYCKEYRFLVTGGFDHDALVWNPYCGNLICKLIGHTSSLVNVFCVPGTPEVITADESGIMKVWDARNFSCVQTLSLRSKVGAVRLRMSRSAAMDHSCARPEHISFLTYSLKNHRIAVAVDKRVVFYDYDRPTDLFLSDSQPTQAVLFNSSSLTFLTVAGKDAKIWDAQTGRLLRIYREISSSEITAMCLDKTCRKMLLGSNDGQVTMFNVSNGAKLNVMGSHSAEVCRLVVCNKTQTVIAAFQDSLVIVMKAESTFEDGILRKMHHASAVPLFLQRHTCVTAPDPLPASMLPLTERGVLEGVKLRRCALNAMAYSYEQSGIVTGASDSTVCLWDLRTGKPETVFFHDEFAEITAVDFLTPYPAIVSADSQNNVNIWAIRPLQNRGSCLARWQPSFRSLEVHAVTCIDWNAHLGKLAVADEVGYLSVWNLDRPFFESLDVHMLGEYAKVSEHDCFEEHDEGSLVVRLTKRFEQVQEELYEENYEEEEEEEEEEQQQQQQQEQHNTQFKISQTISLNPHIDNQEAFLPTNTQNSMRHKSMQRPSSFLKSSSHLVLHDPCQVDMQMQWATRAHTCAIRSISLSNEIGTIITTSDDCTVCTWDLQGNKAGTLFQGSADKQYADSTWGIQLDLDTKIQTEKRTAQRLLQAIDSENTSLGYEGVNGSNEGVDRTLRGCILSKDMDEATATLRKRIMLLAQKGPISVMRERAMLLIHQQESVGNVSVGLMEGSTSSRVEEDPTVYATRSNVLSDSSVVTNRYEKAAYTGMLQDSLFSMPSGLDPGAVGSLNDNNNNNNNNNNITENPSFSLSANTDGNINSLLFDSNKNSFGKTSETVQAQHTINSEHCAPAKLSHRHRSKQSHMWTPLLEPTDTGTTRLRHKFNRSIRNAADRLARALALP